MAHKLLKVAFGKSAGRSFSTCVSSFAINKVTVIGGGLMGAGIAQVAAQSGNTVNLVVDVNADVLKKSQGRIETSVQRVAKKQFKDHAAKAESFVKDIISKLTYTTDRHKAVADSDFVLEATVENLKVKQKLFGDIDKVAPQHTIFASNTSSMFAETASKPIQDSFSSKGRLRKDPKIYEDKPLEEDEKGRLIIYKGILATKFFYVKMFSISSSIIGILMQIRMFQEIGQVHIAVAMAGSVFIFFFTFITPYLINILARRYVTSILYETDLDRYTIVRYNFFGIKNEISCNADDLESPEVPGPLSTFVLKKNGKKIPLFIVAQNFEDPIHYGRFMRFDKPLDLHLDLNEEIEKVKKATQTSKL